MKKLLFLLLSLGLGNAYAVPTQVVELKMNKLVMVGKPRLATSVYRIDPSHVLCQYQDDGFGYGDAITAFSTLYIPFSVGGPDFDFQYYLVDSSKVTTFGCPPPGEDDFILAEIRYTAYNHGAYADLTYVRNDGQMNGYNIAITPAQSTNDLTEIEVVYKE